MYQGPFCVPPTRTHIHTRITPKTSSLDILIQKWSWLWQLTFLLELLDFVVLRVFKWRMNSNEFELKMLLYPDMRVIKHIHVTKAQIKVQIKVLNFIYNVFIYIYLFIYIYISGEGNGNPLQYSCLENPRDRGAWWAVVYGVAQSQTRLKRFSSSSSIYISRWKITKPP